MDENIFEVGRVEHFFTKINVAVIKLTAPIANGDTILFKGPITNFDQKVESMQIEHKSILQAEAGQDIGLKVNDRVRKGDIIYKQMK